MKSRMKEMVGGCCVCAEEQGWDLNPLVYCDGHGCDVAVHQACYGIVSVPVGSWYCRKCESQERAARVKCELCPQKEGALKRTDSGAWCHVVCALYIPEAWFEDVQTMEPIVLKGIPLERFSKQCDICNLVSGACMQCNKAGCKQQFHVTCAQSQGLLCEERSGKNSTVKYCGYCATHYKKAKKDGSVKPIPAFRPAAALDMGEKNTGIGKLDKSKNQIRAASSSSSATISLSPHSVTPSKGEAKERPQQKVSDILSSEPATTHKSSGLPQSSVATSIGTSNGIAAKSSIGKFTTANFVETTIVPSPANFGIASAADRNIQSGESSGNIVRTGPSSVAPQSVSSPITVGLLTTSGLNEREDGPVMLANSVVTSSLVTTAASSAHMATSSAPTFSHTFKNFVGQYSTLNSSPPQAGDLPSLSSSGEGQRKRRMPKSAGDGSGKPAKKGKGDKGGDGASTKAKTVKNLLEAPSAAASPPTLSPVYASPLLPAPVKKSETKRAITNIISRLSPTGTDDQPTSSSQQSSLSVTLNTHRDSREAATAGDVAVSQFATPQPPSLWTGTVTTSTASVTGSSSQMPTTMEQLLERQWEQGSQFLMEQGQHFDIASLLSCLYQLKAENRSLEEHIAVLTARRDHLLAVNARLAVPLTAPSGSTSNTSQHLSSTPTAGGSTSTSTSTGRNEPSDSVVISHGAVIHDNGLDEVVPQSVRRSKSPRANPCVTAASGNYTPAQDAGSGRYTSHPTVTVGQNSSTANSANVRSPLEGNLSLIQQGVLGTGFLPAAAAVHLPVVPSAATDRSAGSQPHPSPTKKSRSSNSTTSGPSAAQLAASAVGPQPAFSMPPPGLVRQATGSGTGGIADVAGFFQRPSQDAMEQLQRQHALQQQLIAQLTPQDLLFQMTQQRLGGVLASGLVPTSATQTSLLASAVGTQHQRAQAVAVAQQGLHTDKSGSVRKEKN